MNLHENFVFSRILAIQDQLTQKEKSISAYISSHLTNFEEITALSIAEETHTSLASVVRFCKHCGFSGFGEMKALISKEVLEPQKLKQAEISAHDSSAVIKQKVLNVHTSIIQNLDAIWDGNAFEKVAQALLKAKRIIVQGEGGSKSAALALFDVLTQVKLPCENYTDSVYEIMKVAQLEKGDVFIGITHTGRLRTTVDSMRLAQERGAITVALVGVPNTPIAKYADIILQTDCITKKFYFGGLTTKVAELAAVEVLSTIVIVRLSRPIECEAHAGSENPIVNIRRIGKK